MHTHPLPAALSPHSPAHPSRPPQRSLPTAQRCVHTHPLPAALSPHRPAPHLGHQSICAVQWAPTSSLLYTWQSGHWAFKRSLGDLNVQPRSRAPCLSLCGLLLHHTIDGVVYKQQTLISHHSRGWLPLRPDRIFTGVTGRSPAHLVRHRIVRSAPCRVWCHSVLTLCARSHPHDQDACLFHHPKTLPEGHTHLTAHLAMSDLFSIPIVCHF